MHAARLHTTKPHVIPQQDAEKYDTLIGMAVDGKYELTNVLPDEIAKHEAALKTKIEKRKAKVAHRMKPRGRKKQRPTQQETRTDCERPWPRRGCGRSSSTDQHDTR